MDIPALLVQLRTEIEQFGQLADATLPDSARKPVPACEGMVLGELVRHVGSVHRVVTQWVREGRRPTTWATAPEAGDNPRRVGRARRCRPVGNPHPPASGAAMLDLVGD